MVRISAAHAPARRLALPLKGGRHSVAALVRMEAATPSRRFHRGLVGERGRESLIAVAPGGRSARARRAPARVLQVG
jgi:hypothetical protein